MPSVKTGLPRDGRLVFKWRSSIDDYEDEELIVAEFAKGADTSRAIRVIYSDPDLKGLPWDSPDGLAMFIPRESVELLRGKGLSFGTSELLKSEELPREKFEAK